MASKPSRRQKRVVHLLDYGAGNVRSVRNALTLLGCEIVDVSTAEEVDRATVLIFPGVGSFGHAVERLKSMKVWEALKRYLGDPSRPFLGICIGMQVLFESSSECPGIEGLGVFAGAVDKFDGSKLKVPVPHIGWNEVRPTSSLGEGHRFYFVHSFRVAASPFASGTATYGGETFVAAVQRENQCAVQFHPEKSADQGLALLDRFLETTTTTPVPKNGLPLLGAAADEEQQHEAPRGPPPPKGGLAKRIVCALDVRENDAGDLVVTKGDSYDVREKTEGRAVRNLGKPVHLAERYYREGCDEIAILNICAFKGEPIADLPLLSVLREASTKVFVPITIGGGVRGYERADGIKVDALQVASAYFRAGADKVSIGSDAVYAAQRWLQQKNHDDGDGDDGADDFDCSVSQISQAYGAQAVVVSIDPKRAWLSEEEEAREKTTKKHNDSSRRYVVEHPTARGPKGETKCWYRCTVAGGRKETDLDAVVLAMASESLGAGEIMLNCIDTDGQNSGFELPLISLVKKHVNVPVIASSGAGNPQHFVDVFHHTNADAALAAGIFHRQEVPIADVKAAVHRSGIPVRGEDKT